MTHIGMVAIAVIVTVDSTPSLVIIILQNYQLYYAANAGDVKGVKDALLKGADINSNVVSQSVTDYYCSITCIVTCMCVCFYQCFSTVMSTCCVKFVLKQFHSTERTACTDVCNH